MYIDMSVYGFIAFQGTNLGNIMLNKTSTTLDFPSNTTTLNKKEIVYSNSTVIKETDIVAQMNGSCINGDQIFTFGPKIQDKFVAAANTTNTLLYSTNGINWYGLGSSFGGDMRILAYNGRIWVSTGLSQSAFSYSYNGINWVSLNSTLFSNTWGVAWNGTMWVVGGSGSNTLAYSYDGINWTGLGQSVFGSSGLVREPVWNGYMWLACGSDGTNTLIAYSYDGINWSTSGSNASSIITSSAITARWNGTVWIAGSAASGGTLGYSYNGITWSAIPSASSIISTYVSGISWNGKMWHATGLGSPYFSYTYDVTGQSGWTTITTTAITNCVNSIRWNGRMFVVTGNGTNNFAYSYNGINWLPISGSYCSFGTCVESTAFRPHSITFPRNLTIAVGSGSLHTLAYSFDGINFTGLGNTIFGIEGNSVKYNGRYWVAGGQGGNSLAFSKDNYTWTGLGSSVFTQTKGLAYSNTMWVGVGTGNGNSIAYSNDGLTWVGLGNSVFTTGNRVAWNGTVWVAVGSGNNNTIAYSTNGIQWTGLGSIFNTQGNGIGWNGSMWIAVGDGTTTTNTAYSLDGITWSYAINTINTTINNVLYANNKWISLGGSSASYSYDGINWTMTVSSPFSINGNSISYNGSVWTAAGQGSSSIVNSYDGINWVSAPSSPFSNYGTDVATNFQVPPKPYIQHPTIAVSTGTTKMHYSPDGIIWQPLNTNVFSTQANRCFWNGSIWVACGSGGNTLAYSNDGVNWTGLGIVGISTTDLGATALASKMNGICYNGKIWVAVGSGYYTIAYSYDGLNWKSVPNSNAIFSSYGQDVAWNGIAFVATGAGTNTIATSTDGITWQGSVSGSTFSTNGAGIWSNGPLWVATGTGTNSIIYTWDTTGRTGWTAVASNPFSTSGSDVAWNGSIWVAVGSGSSHTVATSIDGITWTGRGLVVPTTGGGICWNGVRWILTSNTGSATPIYYSQNGINWYSTGYSITSSLKVSSNSGVGAFAPPSAMVLNNYGINGNGFASSQTLDVVSSNPYYQNGWDNVSITINPTFNPNYNPTLYAPIPTNSYLDTSKLFYAFSARLVVPSYTGPIFRIRRSSDNVESDFYSDISQNWLTTGPYNTGTSYDSWITTNIGYVSIWYDQSGKGSHATQTNTSLQPQFTNYLSFNKYVILFSSSGSGTWLTISNVSARSNTVFCNFYTLNANSTYNTLITVAIGTDFGIRLASQTINGGGNSGDWYTNSNGTKISYVNNVSTVNVPLTTWNNVALSIEQPGISYSGSSNGLSVIGTDGFDRTRGLNGFISELMAHNTQFKASETVAFYTNRLLINNLTYTTTSLLNYAFSVRLVIPTYTGAIIRIRRSSDNVESDFYSDRYQTWITTGANNTGTSYSSWIGANTGYVTKWYDQSGSGRHATQTTNANQPTFSNFTKYVIQFSPSGSGTWLTISSLTTPAYTFLCNCYTIDASSFHNTLMTAAIGTDFGIRQSFQIINGGDSNDWYLNASGTKLNYVNNVSTGDVPLTTWNSAALSIQTPLNIPTSAPSTVTTSSVSGLTVSGPTTVSTNTVYSFTLSGSTNGTCNVSFNANMNIQVLVVAGGGGGGGLGSGGGGGAGGVIYNSSFAVTNGTSYAIQVGAGGIGASGNTQLGGNGSNSVFSSLTAIGGGGGATNSYLSPASNGGSGGGGGADDNIGGMNAPGNGTAGQGNMGGYAVYRYGGGGGGGAGSVGGNASGSLTTGTGGNGGNGILNSITGSATYYGGGGGGGTWSGNTGGTGGSGGGGAGGVNGSNGATTAANGTNGTANTGGGGGGIGFYNSTNRARVSGNGGSGIVIISFPSNAAIISAPAKLTVIGTDGFGTSRGLNGYMSELIGHNTPLTASDITPFYINRLL